MSTPTSLRLPAPVSAVAFGGSGKLGVASDDGVVRLYNAPYNKVAKATRTRAPEISSLGFRPGVGELWVACGQQVLCFSLDDSRMILEQNDAIADIRLTNEEDDVLNEIAINATHLAYTLDSGSVGILDLKSHEQARMKVAHKSICSNVSFIPDRPHEIVSGGYDSALLHFDFHRRIQLSSFQISGPAEPSAQVSLSPPFILCLAVSSTGLVACGLADGRIWLGSGGEQAFSNEGSSNERKKRRRKWEGLRASDGSYHQIAEGPVVAVSFTSPILLLTLTLLGTLALHNVEGDKKRRTIWTAESRGLIKANAMASQGSYVAVGGIGSDQKGILLLHNIQETDVLP